MVAYLRSPGRRAQGLGLSLVAVCGVVASFATVALSGTKTGAALGVGLTAGPALLYVAITTPVLFPLGLYAIVTPFDSILDLPVFGTLTKIIGIASAAALLFYMLRTKRFADPPRSVALWILLFLWMTSSMFWAIDPELAWHLIPTQFSLIALYIITAMMPSNLRTLRLAAGAAAAGGALAALYGVHLFRSGGASAAMKDRLWIHTDTSSWNPDHYAAALILPLALCLLAVLWSRSTLVRISAGLSICVMLLAMVYSGTRGAVVGVAGMILYLLIRDRHRIQLAVTGGLMTAAALVVEGPKYIARWQMAGQTGGAGRAAIWHVGWHAFLQNWLYGAGYGNFPLAYDRAFIGVFQPVSRSWDRASHSIFVGTAVELGVVGLVLLLAAWWGQVRMLRGIPPTDARWPYRLALEATVIALFINGAFLDIMTWKYTWLAFMLMALVYNTKTGHVARETVAQYATGNA